MRPSGLYFRIRSSLLDDDCLGDGVPGCSSVSLTPGTLIVCISEFTGPELTRLPALMVLEVPRPRYELLRLLL